MAEKEGFEPSIRDKPDTPLAGERLRPLGHFSNFNRVFLRSARIPVLETKVKSEFQKNTYNFRFIQKTAPKSGGGLFFI